MGQLVAPEAFPFIGPTNLEYSPVTDAERCINLYYEPSYQGRNQPCLVGTPGLSTPLVTLAQTPVRALASFGAGGSFFAVGGLHVYLIQANSGTVLNDITFGGVLNRPNQQCKFASNNVQFMMLDPQNTQPALFSIDIVGNTATARMSAFCLEYLDGFFVALATGAALAGTNPNQINTSAFNDGTSWPALAFAIKEGSDDQIVQLAVVRNLLWVFGTKTVEIWYNAGLPNFPFARINGGTINIGCVDGNTVVKIPNGVIWVGSSLGGWGRVYMSEGLSAVPISTPAIEQIISRALTPDQTDLNQCSAYFYEEAGHSFYVLNLRLAGFLAPAGSGLTLVYDLTTKMWHERQYWNAGNPIMALPWVGVSVISAIFNSIKQVHVGNFPGVANGSGTQGAIYKMGLQYASDNGVAIQRKRISSHVTDGLRWVKYPYFEVHADIGTASMTVLYSNDGGQTFPSLLRPDATIAGQTPANTLGTYKQFRWRQLGRARKRAMGITILDSTNTPIVLERAQLRATMGTEV